MTTASNSPDGGVQSAVQSPPRTPETPPRATRAYAREVKASTVQPQPDSAPHPDPPKVTASDYAADAAAWVQGTFTPPDVWRDPSASLADRWAYATQGEWTGQGFIRTAGQVYALAIALPAAAVCRVADWVIERPGRAAAAGVLLAVLAQFPPVSWLF